MNVNRSLFQDISASIGKGYWFVQTSSIKLYVQGRSQTIEPGGNKLKVEGNKI